MPADPSYLLGEYGARLNSLEAQVNRIDHNVAFLVTRETERATKEKQTKLILASAGGFFGAVIAFVASILKDWVVR
jgi:hypothetical protein